MKKLLFYSILSIFWLSGFSQDSIYIYNDYNEKIYFKENKNIRYVKFDNINSNNCKRHIDDLSFLSERVDAIETDMYRFKITDGNISIFDNSIKNIDSVQYATELLYMKDSTVQCCFNKILLQIKTGYDLKEELEKQKIPFSSYKQFGYYDNEYLIILKTSEAIKQANILYESGKFIYSVPSFCRFNALQNPYYPQQWGLKNTGQNGGVVGTDINVEPAWELSTGDGVKIAVIDNGVQLNHPDLQNNLLQGYDATGNGSNGGFTGSDYHGTCCAGIIAASNNAIGIKGIAYNSKIIPIRVALGNDSNDEALVAAFFYAYNADADIISCSWGGGSPIPTLTNIINVVSTQGRNGLGCPVLFSSGNNNSSSVSYPASLSSTIAVGAMSPCGERKYPSSCDGETYWGSNYGSGLDVIAPGVLIPTTTINSSYVTNFNGTSAACPHAAGVMALILSANPCLTQEEAREILIKSCDKNDSYAFCINTFGTKNNEVGYGKINAYKAVLHSLDLQNVYNYHVAGNVGEPISNSRWILLNTGCTNIASGTYSVKRYEVSKTISFPYTENPVIMGSVNGFSAASPNNGGCYMYIENLTNTSVSVKTWVYYVEYNFSGQTINTYIPNSSNNVYFDVSIIDAPDINSNIMSYSVSSGVYNRSAIEKINTSDFTVSGTASVNLHAGKYISMQDGTIISPQSSGQFRAYVEPFNPCPSSNRFGNVDEKTVDTENLICDYLLPIESEKSNNSSKENIVLYPNPNKGSFHVILPDSEAEILKISVTDIMGKIVFSKEHFTNGEIHIPNAKPGMYYITATLKNQIITKKIIIQ